jgi:hypothetical protein
MYFCREIIIPLSTSFQVRLFYGQFSKQFSQYDIYIDDLRRQKNNLPNKLNLIPEIFHESSKN